jgi:insulysin
MTMTKDEIIASFMKYVHPSSQTRSKMSIHVESQAFTPTQAVELLQVIQQNKIPVDQTAFDTFIATTPSISELEVFAKNYLDSFTEVPSENKDAVMNAVRKLKEFGPMPKGATLITDTIAFKNSLTLAPPAKPMEDYKDFLSHL